MKRLWLVLLSLAMVLVFSASVFAIDVTFSGEYYAAGLYQDKTSFQKGTASDGPSTAFYYQRLRLKTEFVVSPGLKFITRFDAMERAWGATRSLPTATTNGNPLSYATVAENENIAIDWAYVEYTSPIGLFAVGVLEDGGWGTVFGDTSQPQGMLLYGIELNGWTAGINVVKVQDNSRAASQVIPSTASDLDMDKYQIAAFYEWKTGKAGLLGVFYRAANFRQLAGLTAKIYVLQPFVMLNLGPVKVQTELNYAWGDIKNDNPGGQEFRVDNLAGWIDAGVDWKQFYFGGSFAYVAGAEWNNCSFTNGGVIRGGFLTGGMDWNPTLILFNNDRQYWSGDINGHDTTGTFSNDASKVFGLNDTGMYNAWFFQLRAGVRPIDKLDIMASVSYALADNKTLGTLFGGFKGEAVSNVYGTEINLVGTYKITNNLSYVLGAGYLFTGDYFKGSNPNNQVSNNFLVLNKLTLTF